MLNVYVTFGQGCEIRGFSPNRVLFFSNRVSRIDKIRSFHVSPRILRVYSNRVSVF
jgi:hypothetical protein